MRDFTQVTYDRTVTREILISDLAEAERLAEAALAIGTDNAETDAFTIYGAQFANILYFRGRIHELLPLMEAALDDAPELHGYRAAIALGLARSGNSETARRLLDAELAADFRIPDDDGWFYTVGTWAQAAAELQSVPAAGHLLDALVPFRHLFIHSNVVISGAAAMHVGQLEHVLGRFDEAHQSFADGDAVHRRLESPMLLADNQAHWAAMLADRNQAGDRDRAHELASAALDVAVAGGYGYIESRARRVLGRLQQVGATS